MLKIIEKLRNKSPNQKKRIAFIVAFCISGLIFVVWLSVIYPSFKEKKYREDNLARKESSPVSAFSDILSSTFITIGGEFDRLKNYLGGSSGYQIYNSDSLEGEVTLNGTSTVPEEE